MMTKGQLILVLIVGVAISSCSRRPNQVTYVFPDDFREVFIFRGGEDDGIVVSKVDGTRTFYIPPSGVLIVKGELPTRQWHTPSARYANGTPIPIYQPSNQLSKDTVALRGLGTKNEKEDWFVVGTYDDAAKAQERMRGFRWHSTESATRPTQDQQSPP